MRMIAGQTPDWKDTEVWLDGKKIDKCFEADDETGRVWVTNDTVYNGYDVLKGKVEFKKRIAPTPVNNTQGLSSSDLLCYGRDRPQTQVQEVTGVMVDDTTFQFGAPVRMQTGDTLQIQIEVRENGIIEILKVLVGQLQHLGLVS